ncbi:unnamed protein product [Somion occarium]|uniref:G-patch domain-containing protein n=1 Tax=Somion occarium TaxID=3059160 RepID=A0ABP1E3D6_9APHY
MTSRLKRKLNDLGVDTQSSKATENFCLIGTSLPPLEKTKDTNEFVPLWKQDVRDEKGRRRLHGAFTGGFSAGYFNTVGSKEGWTPSTFVSSRAERAKQQAARPEDFMDEEDLAELRESRQLVDENEEMTFADTEAELRKRQGLEADQQEDSITAALADALAPPPTESAGARILMKMGWRPGQGVGPRLTYEQRKAQDRTLGFASNEDDAEHEAKKHMYARRDTPVLTAARKDNAHGLGYTPGMSLNESLGVGGMKGPSGPRLAFGFGLGALNEAEEDDLDIYDGSMGPRGHSRVAYDALEDDDRIDMGSSSRPGNQGRAGPRASSSTSTQTFADGTPVLKGFVLFPEPVVLQNDQFPFPEIPKGWKPNPHRVWDVDKNKENIDVAMREKGAQPPKTRAEWKESLLSADQRGSLLGETPLPSQPRSVFDYLSQKDRERLQNVRGNIALPADQKVSMPPPPPPSEPQPPYIPGQIHIPHIHPSVAKAALHGFQPFTADPVKQSRYTAFLHYASQTSADSSPSSIGIGPMPDQTNDEFNKELSDYAKSATVFKPLSGAMAGRFTSSKILEMGPNIVEGLHTPDVRTTPEPDENGQIGKEGEEKRDEDPRRGAVRMGMYGPLTREVKPWQPARLLCKRFGVKEPEIEMTDADADARKAGEVDKSGTTTSPLAPLKTITEGLENKPELAETSSSVTRNLANVGLGEDETQGRDILTYERPSMDVFKAIFASDDEDSDEEDKENKHMDEEDHIPYFSSSMPDTAEMSQTEPTTTQLPATAKVTEPAATTEKVDLATFKPTFVPRADREARKDKSSDKKKDKKKSSKPALVSFDDEEGGLQVSIAASRRRKHKDEKDGERKKKKRKEKEKTAEEEDEGMWEEAPPPEVVKKMDMGGVTATPPVLDEQMPVDDAEKPAGPQRGRARAVDFM